MYWTWRPEDEILKRRTLYLQETSGRGTEWDWTRPSGERSNSKVSGFPTILVHAHSLLEQKQLWLAQTSFQLDYGIFLATHSLLRLVRSGCVSWDGVMRAAPDDTLRLALLNAFRALKKRGQTDRRVPVGCHCHAKAALQVFESVAAREKYLYKPGKTFVVANGFSSRTPLALQRPTVEHQHDAVQLGCAVDIRLFVFFGTTHLQHILFCGPRKLHQLLGGRVNVALPFAALKTSRQTRMLPASAFGLGLVVRMPGFETKRNALEAFWFRIVLRCVSVPRAVLMHDFAVRNRCQRYRGFVQSLWSIELLWTCNVCKCGWTPCLPPIIGVPVVAWVVAWVVVWCSWVCGYRFKSIHIFKWFQLDPAILDNPQKDFR